MCPRITVADLDSFDEINSEGVSHDYEDDRETEVFYTSSSISEYEPDSTAHLPKEIKLPQDKTDSHSFVEKNTGYEFVCSNSQVANLYSLYSFLVVVNSHVMLCSNLFSSIWRGGGGTSGPGKKMHGKMATKLELFQLYYAPLRYVNGFCIQLIIICFFVMLQSLLSLSCLLSDGNMYTLITFFIICSS